MIKAFSGGEEPQIKAKWNGLIMPYRPWMKKFSIVNRNRAYCSPKHQQWAKWRSILGLPLYKLLVKWWDICMYFFPCFSDPLRSQPLISCDTVKFKHVLDYMKKSTNGHILRWIPSDVHRVVYKHCLTKWKNRKVYTKCPISVLFWDMILAVYALAALDSLKSSIPPPPRKSNIISLL